jgi:hypothetical protein
MRIWDVAATTVDDDHVAARPACPPLLVRCPLPRLPCAILLDL